MREKLIKINRESHPLGWLFCYNHSMNITRYLPSKKVRILIIGLVVIGLGFLAYRLFVKPSTSESDFVDVSLVNSEGRSDYFLDSDNDGAYDWEEALWPELDPFNPDSDGDGVLDGKYIESKRRIAERERLGGDLLDSNLTETQKLGRSALTALIAIAQSGGDFDAATSAQFEENIGDYIGELTLGDNLYTRDQFNLVDDTRENMLTYQRAVTKLFTTYPVATSDIELVIAASENPDDYAGRLRSASKKYNEYLSELASVEVPYAIAGRHTELTNGISQLAAGFDNLLLPEPDDLVSLSLLVQVESIMDQLASSITRINLFFDLIEDPTLFS